MNIWIIHQEANLPQENGPTRHIDMAKALAAQGCQVRLILSNFSHTAKKVRSATASLGNNIALCMVPTPSYTQNNGKRLFAMLVFAFKTAFSSCKGKPKPDAIIGSSPSPFAAFAGYWLAKRMQSRFIYEIRDLWPETLIKLGGVKPHHPLVKLLYAIEKFLAQRADLIIGVLPGLPDYLKKYGIPKEKVFYFPNFSDFEHPPSATPNDKRPSDKFTVIYAGAQGLANALETLIDAANILKDTPAIQIKLIGDGLHKPALIAKAQALGLNNIVFLDPVPKSDIYGVIAQADVCTILWQDSELYRWGTSANKLFDYMVMSKPIITASNSPYAHADCGPVVPAVNAQAFAEAVLKVYHMSKEERELLGKQSFEYGKQYHDLSHLSATLLSRIEKDAKACSIPYNH